MQHPTPEQVEQMADYGRLRMPLETGGVLVKGKLLELPNSAPEDEQGDRYLLTIDQLRETIADATVDEVLFWHTHPQGHVGPSLYDLEGRLEGFQYMVVALQDDGAAVTTRY